MCTGVLFAHMSVCTMFMSHLWEPVIFYDLLGEFFVWFLFDDGFYYVFVSFFSFGGVVWCSFYCLGIEMVLHIAQVCFKLTLWKRMTLNS